VALIHLRVDMV